MLLSILSFWLIKVTTSLMKWWWKMGNRRRSRKGRANQGYRGPGWSQHPEKVRYGDINTIQPADAQMGSDKALLTMANVPVGYSQLSRAYPSTGSGADYRQRYPTVMSSVSPFSFFRTHLKVTIGDLADPSTWVVTSRSDMGTRLLEEYFPLIIELLRTGLGSRPTVNTAQIAYYFMCVESLLNVLYQVNALRYLYYKMDWTTVEPGTTTLPPCVIQACQFANADVLDGSFEFQWMPRIRELSTHIYPPNLTEVMSLFYQPFVRAGKPQSCRVILPFHPSLNLLAEYDFYRDRIRTYLGDVEAVMRSFFPWSVGNIPERNLVIGDSIHHSAWFNFGFAGYYSQPNAYSITGPMSIYCNPYFTPITGLGDIVNDIVFWSQKVTTAMDLTLSNVSSASSANSGVTIDVIPYGCVNPEGFVAWHDNTAPGSWPILRAGTLLPTVQNIYEALSINNRYYLRCGTSGGIMGSFTGYQAGFPSEDLRPNIVNRAGSVSVLSAYYLQLAGTDKIRDVIAAIGGSVNREARQFISSLFGVAD